MSSLAELQGAFARSVLTGDAGVAGLPAFAGRTPPDIALRIHRETVIGGLTRALQLAYPTVETLVGPEFFAHAALAFIAVEPPTVANLSAYGDGYARFLQDFAPVRELPYLPDVATLDLAIDRVQRAPALPPRRLRIDAGVALEVPATLRALRLAYPADEIRAVLDAGDPDALGGLDMTPTERIVAVWRSPAGASVQRLRPAAGVFLAAMLDGRAADDACAEAIGDGDAGAGLAEIQADVFAASFTAIIPTLEEQRHDGH